MFGRGGIQSQRGDGIAKHAAIELQRPARAFEITFVLHFTHGGENVRRSDFRDRHAANRNGELRKQVLASRRGGSCPCLLTVTAPLTAIFFRSEERRVGKESVSTFRSRCSPCH